MFQMSYRLKILTVILNAKNIVMNYFYYAFNFKCKNEEKNIARNDSDKPKTGEKSSTSSKSLSIPITL